MTADGRVPQRSVLARNSLVRAPDMSSNPIAVMLYVELGLFLVGLACLVIERILAQARAGRNAEEVRLMGREPSLTLSRSGT